MKTLKRIKQSSKFYESDLASIPSKIESQIKDASWLETKSGTFFVDNAKVAEIETANNLKSIYCD